MNKPSFDFTHDERSRLINKNNYITKSMLFVPFAILNFANTALYEQDNLTSKILNTLPSIIFNIEDFINRTGKKETLYEKICSLYLNVKENNVKIANVQKIVTMYKIATQEEKTECKELLILVLQLIICNHQATEPNKILVALWLRDITIIPLSTNPSSFSKKVYSCVIKAFDVAKFKNVNVKRNYLIAISKLVDQKANATSQDLQNLINTLTFLRILSDGSSLFDESEKIQFLVLLAQLNREAVNFEKLSEFEKLCLICGLLDKITIDPILKETILNFVEQVVVNIIDKMKGEKKVPLYTPTLKILINWGMINQPIFATNKTQIEKWLVDLKTTEEAITKLRTAPPARFLGKRPTPGAKPERPRNPIRSGRPRAIRQLIKPAHKV